GQAGDDRYLFARGDGRDILSDTGGTDVLSISGYRPDELRVARLTPDRNELVLTFADSSDEIVLRYDSGWGGVDRVEFSDGTSYTTAQLLRLTALAATDHDDRILG